MIMSWCLSRKHSSADWGVLAMWHRNPALSHAQRNPLLCSSSSANTKSTWGEDRQWIITNKSHTYSRFCDFSLFLTCVLKPLLRLNPLFSIEFLSTDHCFFYSCLSTEVFQVGETVCQSHVIHMGRTSFGTVSLAIIYKESLGNQLRQVACVSDSVHEPRVSPLLQNCLTCNLFLGVCFACQDHIPGKGKTNLKNKQMKWNEMKWNEI